MLIIVSILLACILGLFGILLLWTSGKPRPFFDENGRPLAGSISEKIQVNINGVEQGMFIKSKDAAHPVLLYLHGGMPDYFLTKRYPTGLEDDFTIVWWEQRGSGMSYSAGIPQDANTWLAKSRSGIGILWNTMIATDLSIEVPEVAVPVYFFHGLYDYTCSYPLAKDYFEKLRAPLKGFYTFEQSAHSPMFEEPEKMQKILRKDVLAGANNLADER